MKKLLIAVLMTITLSSCVDPSKEEIHQDGYKLQLLFEQNGCKMYRFLDGTANYIYWSDCTGKIEYMRRSRKRSTKEQAITN